MHRQRILFHNAKLEAYFPTYFKLVTPLQCCTSLTLTQFLFSIHKYFFLCENSKGLIWQL